MSVEASAKGTSAESANGTTVLLTGELHETQNILQNSLPLTPRLPIDGKPGECKQEAADGVVMAECTKGTVEMAKPCEMVADVDGKAALGRELAERACRVDEGNDTERDGQSRLQQIEFYCKEEHQCNENANSNVPNAHELPLEGEWSVCASGQTTNSNGDADASNAAIECMYRPSESGEAKDAMEIESEGCGEGTSGRACIDELETLVECCQQLAGTVGDPGRGIELADTPNESEELVTTSVEPYVGDGGGTSVRVHLRCTGWRAGDANGPGRGTDVSNGQTDASRGLTDVLRTSNSARMAGISHGDSAGMYLDVRVAKRVVNATDGVGSHTDASSVHTDVHSIKTNTLTTANVSETVSKRRNEPEMPNSPMETAKRHPDKPNSCGSHADGSSARTHAYCIGNDTQTATNEAESVRMHQNGSMTQNSPNGRDIAMPKVARRWRRVSVDNGDVYVPWNTLIAIPSRKIVFGRVESGDEAIAPSVEGERAGEHQQFVECLKCLGQTMSGMSDTSGVPDPCLNSGVFLSGSGIIVWSLSGHSLFSTHQTPSRYTTDIYYRFFSAYSVWSQVYSALVRQQPDTPQTCITGSSSLFSSSQTIPDTGNNNQMKYIIGWLIGIISTVVYYYNPGSNFVEGSPLETPLPGRPTENTADIS